MPAKRPARGFRERLKRLLDSVVGLLTVGVLKTLRLIDRRAMANLSAAVSSMMPCDTDTSRSAAMSSAVITPGLTCGSRPVFSSTSAAMRAR